MSPTVLPVSRRTVLRGVGLSVVGSTLSLSACGTSSSGDDAPEPDPLLAESARARADSVSATAAIAQFPASSDTLTVVSDQRRAHADVLDAEIARLTPPPPTGTTTPTATPEPAPVAAPTLTELAESLSASSRSAADLARTLSGYRAGVLGSVSAACALASSAVSA
ncbi:hypothetical protein ASG56_18240 [Rhodococcus sp. Leaf7]|uniref:hypothetical protein n=1 Tax=unclassified Rhodococcus (in: high G+C Gram-positive bacteria) TaxID=192944 RepID=UPI000701DEF6|nr:MULTISPECIES: hypothetical protein [unclassified Rhodococcus (in: high G+C Gram-positive bacteria)]KQU02806.1 hypothetical protein ASG56_18240 [Rhodococcus sp. Leaf7]KQU38604.1 hypothetical protein ASG64_15725 [Rhodococcus sp. Leaf247]